MSNIEDNFTKFTDDFIKKYYSDKTSEDLEKINKILLGKNKLSLLEYYDVHHNNNLNKTTTQQHAQTLSINEIKPELISNNINIIKSNDNKSLLGFALKNLAQLDSKTPQLDSKTPKLNSKTQLDSKTPTSTPTPSATAIQKPNQ